MPMCVAFSWHALAIAVTHPRSAVARAEGMTRGEGWQGLQDLSSAVLDRNLSSLPGLVDFVLFVAPSNSPERAHHTLVGIGANKEIEGMIAAQLIAAFG
jgi:hypothetical protein